MRYGTYVCSMANGQFEYGFTFGRPTDGESDTGPCEIDDPEFDVVLGVVEDPETIEAQWKKYQWVADAIMSKAPREPKCHCHTGPEWSGSPNPANPDNEWVCDDCGRVIPA